MRLCRGCGPSPVYRLKKTADEAKEELTSNIKVMDDSVHSVLAEVDDPDVKKYLEASTQMQEKLIEISGKIGEVSAYCQKVISWLEDFTDF